MASRDLRAALEPVECFLLDMDGTFYLGDHLLPGCMDFLQKLKETGRRALFVTNNSSQSAEAYRRKLQAMGVPPPFLEVLTSGQAAGRQALALYPGQKPYVLGNAVLRQELADMGLRHQEVSPDFVLVGYDTTLDYPKLTKVCDLIRSGLPYMATHPDKNCPTEQGFVPDIGAIIAFIQASTDRMPDVIVGKPHRGIVEDALRITGTAPRQLAVVGDRLYTDIAAGVNFGILSLLVLTGETRRQDLQNSPIQPDFVLERLASMIEYL